MAKAKKPASKNAKSAATSGSKPESAPVSSAKETVSSASKAAATKATPSTSAKPAEAKANTAPKAEPTPAPADAKPAATPAKKPVVETKPAPAADAVVKADAAPKPAPTPPPAKEEPRSIFMPLVLGGLIAGGLGFAAGQYNWFGQQADTSGLDAAISAQAERLTALETAEPVMPEVDLSAIDDMASKVTGLSETLTDIEARLTIVEERPAPDGGPSIAENTAFERELEALKTSAEEQRAEIATLLSNAQSVKEATAAAAKAAQIQSAVSQITTAISTGQPFADTLADLSEGGVTDIPAALSDVADDGVVTLTNLQSRFPDTARAALGVARTSGAMEGETGVGGFLKRQLGARSTAPREGSDPDAVLSRAEAAVRDGSLDTALTEIDALPEDVQSAMQDWLDDARARNAAALATQDLSQSLPAN